MVFFEVGGEFGEFVFNVGAFARRGVGVRDLTEPERRLRCLGTFVTLPVILFARIN